MMGFISSDTWWMHGTLTFPTILPNYSIESLYIDIMQQQTQLTSNQQSFVSAHHICSSGHEFHFQRSVAAPEIVYNMVLTFKFYFCYFCGIQFPWGQDLALNREKFAFSQISAKHV